MAITGTASRAQGTAQTLLQETFHGPTTAAAVVTLNTGAPGFPCLTADPAGAPVASTVPNCGLSTPDAAGQGALRFTSVTEQQASGFVAATSLPTGQGLSIAFTQYQYGGHGLGGPGSDGGGDGISFFLAVAPPHPQVLGPQGGALGYASAGSADGLPGAWLGIGLDAFGNYSNPLFGNPACPVPSWAGFNADSVTVRGPGHGTNGYCLIASSADDVLTAGGLALRGVDRASSARRIQVQITPSDGRFRVFVDDGSGPELATSGVLPSSYYDPETGALVNGLPPRITFGFAASTGSATDIHEIADLTATTITGGVPVLGLTKTTTLTGAPSPGQGFGYVITPRVTGSVAETAPLSIRVSDTLPAGVTMSGAPSGTPWNCSLTSATSFECAYTAASSIPAGTVLSGITVPVVVGAGVAPGATITNTASVLSDDAAAPVSASVTVTVASPPPPLTITTTTLPAGTTDTAYSTTLAATGGSGGRTWTVSSGALPGGVALATNGVLSGTPTASGPYAFAARVADSAGAADTQALTLTVNPAVAPLTITTATLPGGTVGVAYAATLAATGGTGARTWAVSAGALPSGVTLSNAGLLAGTPTLGGTFAFTARVVDAAGAAATRALSIAVSSATPLAITTASLPPAEVDVRYTQALTATGGTTPYRWTIQADALPAGLNLSLTGVIGGVPTTPGAVGFTVRVTDAAGRFAVRRLSIGVRLELEILTTSLADGRTGTPYRALLQRRGGLPPLAWAIASGALPAGLTLSTDGVIAGIPTATGTAAFWVRVTDALGGVAARQLTIRIVRPEKAYIGVDTGTGQVCTAQSQCEPTIAVFDVASGSLVRTIPLDPLGGNYRSIVYVATTPDGRRVFAVVRASLSGQFTVFEIDTTTDAVVRSASVGANAHATSFALSSDGSLLYFTSYITDFGVNALDTATLVTQRIRSSATESYQIVQPSPDGASLYVLKTRGATPGNGIPGSPAEVLTLNASTGAVIRRLSLGWVALVDAKLTPNGRRLLITTRANSSPNAAFRLLDVSTSANVVAADVPTDALEYFVVPDNQRLFGTVWRNPLLSVDEYALSSRSLTRRVPMPGQSGGLLAVSPSRAAIYVLTHRQGANLALSRIDVAGGNAVRVATLDINWRPGSGLAVARGSN